MATRRGSSLGRPHAIRATTKAMQEKLVYETNVTLSLECEDEGPQVDPAVRSTIS